jgi:putative ABC transport system permease protein
MNQLSRLFVKITSAIKSIYNNLFRSFLSAFGVMIGIVAIFVMLTLSSTFNNIIESAFSSDVDLAVYVYLYENMITYEDTKLLLDTNKEEFAISGYSFYKTSMPDYYYSPQLANFDNSYSQINFTEIDENYLDLRSIDLLAGNTISKLFIENKAPVVLISEKIATEFYKGVDPLGSYINIDGKLYNIIGITESPKSSWQKYQIYLPYGSLTSINAGDGYNALIFPNNVAEIETIQSDITSLLLLYQHGNALVQNKNDYFNIEAYNPTSALKFLENFKFYSTLILTVIGSISLFVSAIGIMNTMLASISERTNEIGLRKALGANFFDIILLFLIETLIITFVGCFMAIVVVINIINIINIVLLKYFANIVETEMFGNIIIINSANLAIIVTITFITALIAGIYPALRAGRMNPIEALRSV